CGHLGLPYAETDATRYAEVGYKGLQLPQMFIPLLREAARMKDLEAQEVAPDGDQMVPAWAPKPEKDPQNDVFKRDDIEDVIERASTTTAIPRRRRWTRTSGTRSCLKTSSASAYCLKSPVVSRATSSLGLCRRTTRRRS